MNVEAGVETVRNTPQSLIFTCFDIHIFRPALSQTEATIATFFFFMASHPEVMRRAQAEIDKVIGSSRLPTLGDRAELPFVDCIMKETLRFSPN